MKKATLLASAMLLMLMFNSTGCATSPYIEYYEQIADASSIHPLPEGEVPKIMEVDPKDGKFMEAQKNYLRDNYQIIGESAFEGGIPDNDGLIKQAKKVGAKIVLHGRKYLKTKTGVRSVTTYNYNPPKSAYSRFSGNVGGTSFSGSGTTTTQSSYTPSTSYVPYSEDMYAINALYFRPFETKPRIGIMKADLTSKERGKLGTNKGVKIVIVVKRSPAYEADLLEGDFLLKVDGRQIEDAKQLDELMDNLPTEKIDVVFEVFRKGSRKAITLHLPAK